MRTNFIPTWLFLCSAILPGAIASTASAGFVLTTGITGAEVGCDINHTQHWTYTVTQDIADVEGALLTMKRGPSTNASITFSIFEGVYADYGIATNLLSSTLTPTAFTQQFTPVAFSANPITFVTGKIYTAVLASSAPDAQNQAYFIKAENLSANDPRIVSYIPTPGAISLLALSAGCFARRRR